MNDIADKFLPTITVKNNVISDCNETLTELLEMQASDIIGTALQAIFSLKVDDGQSTQDSPLNNQHNTDNLLFIGSLKNNYNYDLPVKVHYQKDEADNNNYKLYFQTIKNKSVDAITDLPNGWALFSRANYLLSDPDKVNNKFIILILSIDNFSTINFRYGYDVGDDYLLTFAKNLSATAPDDLVVRFSNAKFGILVANRDALSAQAFESQTVQLCERICALSDTPITLNRGINICKYLSIGVSKTSAIYADFHAMEIAAETALIVAKKYSISKYSIATTITANDFLYRKLIIDELPNVIEEDQINIHYQPQYDLNNGKLIGFEALSKWCHKTLGNIAADTFINIAEEISLHFELDLWVFNQVCSQIVDWEQKGLALPRIAINVSFKTLEMTTFIPRIIGILEKTQCPTNLIELEITETAYAENVTNLHENILQIKKLGINIAVDDFGSGYSSLSLIRTFHLSLDILKIDRSLVDNICNTAIDREFTQKIIEMGKVLNLKVLAEGVENKEQYDLLKKLGCDYAQGYYFDKALARKQAEQLMLKA